MGQNYRKVTFTITEEDVKLLSDYEDKTGSPKSRTVRDAIRKMLKSGKGTYDAMIMKEGADGRYGVE